MATLALRASEDDDAAAFTLAPAPVPLTITMAADEDDDMASGVLIALPDTGTLSIAAAEVYGPDVFRGEISLAGQGSPRPLLRLIASFP